MKSFIFTFLILCFGAANIYAQSLPDTTQPIAIDADSLEVIQTDSKAIFKGDVKATQGDMTLYSNIMTVYYAQNDSESAVSAMGALSRIEVDGNVRMKTKGESATAQKGVYDADKKKVFLFGNVVLKRGANVLNGSKLEYNITSGASMLSGGVTGNNATSSSAGRVRGVFVPGKN